MSNLINVGSYFKFLPNEILLIILSYVDTFDLQQFCEAYSEYNIFLKDKSIIRDIIFYKRYALKNLKSISTKICFDLVITLNLNCIYWISAKDLRKFICKLVNLQNLYVIKTQLSLSIEDISLYSSLKISKLALTITNALLIASTERCDNIKSLYVDVAIPHSKINFLIRQIFSKANKIWLDMEINYFLLPPNYPNELEKMFVRCTDTGPIVNNIGSGPMEIYYKNMRFCQPCTICFEKFDFKPHTNIMSLKSSGISKAWNTFIEMHCPLPYGPKDARKLFLNKCTLENIAFDELNFHHGGPTCNKRCREASIEILMSKTAQSIKKLYIMMCLLQWDNVATTSLDQNFGFKKRRLGIENSSSHPFQEIFNNFPNLEHLEILLCTQIPDQSTIQAYPLIASFQKLKCLVLEIPIFIDGSFLIHVFKHCKQLQIFKIKPQSIVGSSKYCFPQHENLNFNIRKAITEATSLKDFRFINKRVQLDKLFTSLGCIQTKKLERLVIYCDEVDEFSSKSLTTFLECNPQLVFIYIVISKLTKQAATNIASILKLYMQDRAKVFLVKTNHHFSELRGFPIPDVHFCEMLENSSDVATLNPYNDFVTF